MDSHHHQSANPTLVSLHEDNLSLQHELYALTQRYLQSREEILASQLALQEWKEGIDKSRVHVIVAGKQIEQHRASIQIRSRQIARTIYILAHMEQTYLAYTLTPSVQWLLTLLSPDWEGMYYPADSRNMVDEMVSGHPIPTLSDEDTLSLSMHSLPTMHMKLSILSTLILNKLSINLEEGIARIKLYSTSGNKINAVIMGRVMIGIGRVENGWMGIVRAEGRKEWPQLGGIGYLRRWSSLITKRQGDHLLSLLSSIFSIDRLSILSRAFHSIHAHSTRRHTLYSLLSTLSLSMQCKQISVLRSLCTPCRQYSRLAIGIDNIYRQWTHRSASHVLGVLDWAGREDRHTLGRGVCMAMGRLLLQTTRGHKHTSTQWPLSRMLTRLIHTGHKDMLTGLHRMLAGGIDKADIHRERTVHAQFAHPQSIHPRIGYIPMAVIAYRDNMYWMREGMMRIMGTVYRCADTDHKNTRIVRDRQRREYCKDRVGRLENIARCILIRYRPNCIEAFRKLFINRNTSIKKLQNTSIALDHLSNLFINNTRSHFRTLSITKPYSTMISKHLSSRRLSTLSNIFHALIPHPRPYPPLVIPTHPLPLSEYTTALHTLHSLHSDHHSIQSTLSTVHSTHYLHLLPAVHTLVSDIVNRNNKRMKICAMGVLRNGYRVDKGGMILLDRVVKRRMEYPYRRILVQGIHSENTHKEEKIFETQAIQDSLLSMDPVSIPSIPMHSTLYPALSPSRLSTIRPLFTALKYPYILSRLSTILCPIKRTFNMLRGYSNRLSSLSPILSTLHRIVNRECTDRVSSALRAIYVHSILGGVRTVEGSLSRDRATLRVLEGYKMRDRLNTAINTTYTIINRLNIRTLQCTMNRLKGIGIHNPDKFAVFTRLHYRLSRSSLSLAFTSILSAGINSTQAQTADNYRRYVHLSNIFNILRANRQVGIMHRILGNRMNILVERIIKGRVKEGWRRIMGRELREEKGNKGRGKIEDSNRMTVACTVVSEIIRKGWLRRSWERVGWVSGTLTSIAARTVNKGVSLLTQIIPRLEMKRYAWLFSQLISSQKKIVTMQNFNIDNQKISKRKRTILKKLIGPAQDTPKLSTLFKAWKHISRITSALRSILCKPTLTPTMAISIWKSVLHSHLLPLSTSKGVSRLLSSTVNRLASLQSSISSIHSSLSSVQSSLVHIHPLTVKAMAFILSTLPLSPSPRPHLSRWYFHSQGISLEDRHIISRTLSTLSTLSSCTILHQLYPSMQIMSPTDKVDTIDRRLLGVGREELKWKENRLRAVHRDIEDMHRAVRDHWGMRVLEESIDEIRDEEYWDRVRHK